MGKTHTPQRIDVWFPYSKEWMFPDPFKGKILMFFTDYKNGTKMGQKWDKNGTIIGQKDGHILISV